jgi:ABC-2 type transport system permease protein
VNLLAIAPRLFWVGWKFHLKGLTLSSFFLLISIVQPLIFASIAYYMYEAGAREGTLLYVALGAGLMGMWSSTLFGSGGAIQWQRWQGTLELLIGAPPPFILTLLPLTLATASIGLYSIVATLLWGALLFDVPLSVEHPFLFALSLPTTTIALGLLGLVLASTFVLYRQASAFSNLLEYPIWLVSGLLVPISLLPGWVEPLSWVIAPTWGVRAIRDSALGGDPLFAIGMCVLLSVAYLVIGWFSMANFERLARKRATLSLT